jgi:ParB family chromosome partitioning protein
MAVKKRGLGRGLDALLSGPTVSALEEQASSRPANCNICRWS